ncbi:hypothetical protein K678_17396, partial [Magnetospirillum fulvum MGU-K5]
MARAPLKVALLLSAALTVTAPAALGGGMPVFDGTLLGQAVEQLKSMQEQIKNQLAQLNEL